MLSRRDKLLVQPWEERRYRDHRSKVAAALPAIDSGAPAARPHVAVKMKKWQRERERAARLARDNCALLQRLAALMAVNRLDNHRPTPPRKHCKRALYISSQHKVGRFYEARALQERVARRAAPPSPPHSARTRCYACEHNKMRQYEPSAPAARELVLPTLY